MVISPDQLQRSRPEYVSEDRLCVRCGYNLKGLKTSANCPECGRPISKIRRGYRASDNLVQAPLSWLLSFRVATVLLMLAAAVAVVVQFGGPFAIARWPNAVPLAAISAAIAWCVGIMLATRPRPVTSATTLDPREEWRGHRWIAQVTQICWPVSILLGFALVRSGVATTSLMTAAGVLAFIAAIGLIWVCIYLSNVCFWAADTGLAINFRACAWTVTIAGVAMLVLATRLYMLAAAPGAGPGVFGAMITWPVLVVAGVFTFAAMVHLLWCLWRLQGMAAWAVINHVTAVGRDDRMRERAVHAAMHEQRRQTPR